jgi:hypothetical protein
MGVKRPGREPDHSPQSSAEIKERVELYLHSPNTPSWRGAQLKHRNNFTFTLPVILIVTLLPAMKFIPECGIEKVRELQFPFRIKEHLEMTEVEKMEGESVNYGNLFIRINSREHYSILYLHLYILASDIHSLFLTSVSGDWNEFLCQNVVLFM